MFDFSFFQAVILFVDEDKTRCEQNVIRKKVLSPDILLIEGENDSPSPQLAAESEQSMYLGSLHYH